MTYEEVVAFHGHACPGLAIGYRMACAAMEALDIRRAGDEETVAIVENDACGVDALQCITGCTFGKGNLIFRDFGKQVYTLYSRTTGKGVRVVFHGDGIPAEFSSDRNLRARYILSAASDDILTMAPVAIDEPPRAVSRKSLLCSLCNEEVMETRVQDVEGQITCIPCAQGRGLQGH